MATKERKTHKNKPLQLAFACGTNLRRENLILKCSWAPPERRERKIEKKIITPFNIGCEIQRRALLHHR